MSRESESNVKLVVSGAMTCGTVALGFVGGWTGVGAQAALVVAYALWVAVSSR